MKAFEGFILRLVFKRFKKNPWRIDNTYPGFDQYLETGRSKLTHL